jgi:hypothetical protein
MVKCSKSNCKGVFPFDKIKIYEMKKYLISFVALLFTIVAMANNGSQPIKAIELTKLQEIEKSSSKEIASDLKVNSCTATATITVNGVSTTFTNTVTCDCSNFTACSLANEGNSANIKAYVAAIP